MPLNWSCTVSGTLLPSSLLVSLSYASLNRYLTLHLLYLKLKKLLNVIRTHEAIGVLGLVDEISVSHSGKGLQHVVFPFLISFI